MKAGSELTRSHALRTANLSLSGFERLVPTSGRRAPLSAAISTDPGWTGDPVTGVVPACGICAAATGVGVGESGAGTGSSASSSGDSPGSSSERKSSRILSRRPSQPSFITAVGAACCCLSVACSVAAATGGDSCCVGPVVTLMCAP